MDLPDSFLHSFLLSTASDRSSRLHLVSLQKKVFSGWQKLAPLWVEDHMRTLLLSPSFLLQQCPACLICFTWMVCEIRGRWSYSCYFWECCNPGFIYSRPHAAFLRSSHLAFSLFFSLASMWCIHILVWTQLQLGRNPNLFYQIDQTFRWLIICPYIPCLC